MLLMTGHLTTEVTVRALNNHVHGFLPKPFSRKDFLDKVWRLAEQSPRTSKSNPRERVLAIGAHPDHRNTHRATLVAARNVARLKCYQSPSSTIGFTPSHFVDISRKLPEKQALISCYRSQREKCRYLS